MVNKKDALSTIENIGCPSAMEYHYKIDCTLLGGFGWRRVLSTVSGVVIGNLAWNSSFPIEGHHDYQYRRHQGPLSYVISAASVDYYGYSSSYYLIHRHICNVQQTFSDKMMKGWTENMIRKPVELIAFVIIILGDNFY